jgi:1-deoxy-D-xylulose-5-phosphate reductoisomerase
MKKKISILGSTGSIGENALRIIASNPKDFEVVGLSAGRNMELLASQVVKFRPKYISIAEEENVQRIEKSLRKRLSGSELPQILCGENGAIKVATIPEADIIVSAIVGSAALKPTYCAVRTGKRVALANKESIVMAGRIIMAEAVKSNATVLPVDSEHSAIFQSMLGHNRSEIKRLILTASGGPFFKKDLKYLKGVTVKEALKHPNWKMGAKITIDSATLMNKALEVIEARWLFDIKGPQISVMIHPESIVHSIVEYMDGSMIAQMGIPDMRIPISYALSYPQRIATEKTKLSLEKIRTLTFEKPDEKKFPTLKFAYRALSEEDSMSVVLNCANEASVKAFICGKISFLAIPQVVGKVISGHKAHRISEIEEACIIHDEYTKITNRVIGKL